MQIPLLPRDVAGRIITGTVSRIGWAVGAVMIVLSIPMLIETLLRRDRPDEIPLPLAMLLLFLAAIAFVAWRGQAWRVFAFLAVAGVASVVYELALVLPDPALLDDAVTLINRPAVALVTIGVTATTPVAGMLWCTLGYAVSWSVTLVVAAIADVPIRPGLGPTMVFLVVLISYLTLGGIQVAGRRRLPDFEELEAETQRLALGEDLARKTTAVVHDTVLNDLALVMNSPDRLSQPARDRLSSDLATLRSAEWLDSTASIPTGNTADATLRNDIMRLMTDFQWQGLSVHVTGFGSDVYRLQPEVATALLGALRACFDNVLRHSGATIAELEIVYSESTVTLMVTDQGRGFDPDAVPADRLGLRGSVVDRMTAVGGRVDIWSAPGEGTSIVITAPTRRVDAPRPSPEGSDDAQ